MSFEEVAKFIGAVGIGSAALVWLLRTLFAHLLSRDIERFKAELEARHNVEIEKFKSELSLAAFEHQTKFAKLHEDRAKVIEELYKKLRRAGGALENLIAPLKVLGPGGIKELIDEASKHGREFFHYFHENRIYLDADLCKQIDSLNTLFSRTWSEFLPLGDEDNMAKGLQHVEVWAGFKERVPPILEEIEDRFRKLLGVS